eukprot:TRINITY_DN4343_c0_g1_i14.p1 TRINITY_DN4343_c0_g1~~TRINITY_DN4343_c0_g1_i14.p1  ORF type:complete len:187 (-),score=41.37 TRINITY_DN4343_c0_g1_i14:492-1052(-)
MKRVSWLQEFFTELQRNKTFRSSETFQAFMSAADENKFKGMKKQIQKLPGPKGLSEVRLLEGKFNCDLPIRKLRMGAGIGQFVKDAQKLYKELCGSVNATTNTMLLLSDSFAKNAEILKDLELIHTEIEVEADIRGSAQSWGSCSAACGTLSEDWATCTQSRPDSCRTASGRSSCITTTSWSRSRL